MGINECSVARLCILSEELKDYQCPLIPSTPFLSLADPVHLHLHLKSRRQPLLGLLCRTHRLYS